MKRITFERYVLDCLKGKQAVMYKEISVPMGVTHDIKIVKGRGVIRVRIRLKTAEELLLVSNPY